MEIHPLRYFPLQILLLATGFRAELLILHTKINPNLSNSNHLAPCQKLLKFVNKNITKKSTEYQISKLVKLKSNSN